MQNSCIAAYSPVWRLKLRVLTKKFTAMKAIVQAAIKLILSNLILSNLILSNFWLLFYFSILTDLKAFTDIKQFDELHTTKSQMEKRFIQNYHYHYPRRGIRCRITMLFFGFDDEASKGCNSHGLSRLNPHRDDENVLLSLPTAVKVIDWHFS